MTGPTRPFSIPTWGRPLAIAIAVAIIGIALAEFVIVAQQTAAAGDLGDDFLIYPRIGTRYLTTGEFYYPEQLSGPYINTLSRSVFYPPTALIFFVPLALVPLPVAAFLWWAVPIGVGFLLLRRFRPSYLVWPILALAMAWPRTVGGFLFGNSDIWVATAVAAGLLWSWPAVLVALKPSVLPLALIGIRRRSWWIAAVALGLASLLFLPLWPQYVTALMNVRQLGPSLSTNFIFILAPLVVWIGRRREAPSDGAVAVQPLPASS